MSDPSRVAIAPRIGFSAVDWGLVAGVALMWGSSFLLIDIGVEHLEPTLVAWLRIAFGAATLAPDAPLEALTSRTITEPARLAAELEAVRSAGCATAVDELELGLTAIAAPVLDANGRAVAALSVSGPTLRLSPRRVEELRPIVIKQARALSEQLGHRPEGVQAA